MTSSEEVDDQRWCINVLSYGFEPTLAFEKLGIDVNILLIKKVQRVKRDYHLTIKNNVHLCFAAPVSDNCVSQKTVLSSKNMAAD